MILQKNIQTQKVDNSEITRYMSKIITVYYPLIIDKEKLRDYFEKLGSREDLSIALHEKTLIIQELENQIYSLSGIYNWRFAVDGELLNFEARFSYLIDLSKQNPILHHHSSQIPRTL